VSAGRPGWRRRALIAVAAVAATAFVGASIVVATIAGHRSRGEAPPAAVVASGPEQGGAPADPPRAGWVRRRVAGSPPRLAALHRQGARLVGGDLGDRLRRLRGYPVVLNAWASWCAPCRDELPLMARAAARFGRRVAFVGADVDDSASAARALLDGDPLSYPSYRTTADELRSLTPIIGFPTTIFLDRRGRLIRSHQGEYASEALLAADVRRYALGD
jgi:cytochrome c biogenesis protein CcmG/thiol:disulfide interchange protein DsbE